MEKRGEPNRNPEHGAARSPCLYGDSHLKRFVTRTLGEVPTCGTRLRDDG